MCMHLDIGTRKRKEEELAVDLIITEEEKKSVHTQLEEIRMYRDEKKGRGKTRRLLTGIQSLRKISTHCAMKKKNK